ncbi:substrate-binding domain-containing protein [Streptomyces sp. NPDC048172]|uniref:substrate-binding domain-containing protein n=1 Tax=Streptomyces sp. NPDC048172 TaxID=3365505 RepID=UPI003712529C
MADTPHPPHPPRPPGSPPPTSADVARQAGVSRATVSYVLNGAEGSARISEATRARVRAAADELGYVPHAAARALRAGASRMVLMSAPHVPAGPLYARFAHEAQSALSRLGYTVAHLAAGVGGATGDVGDAGAAGDGPGAPADVRAWAELRPTAAVALPPTVLTPADVAVLKQAGTRAVITVGPPRVAGAHSLTMDQREVGAAAVAHLVERGRRRVGVVVPAEPGLDTFSGPRLAGAHAAAVEGSGGGTDVRLRPLPLAFTEESAAALAARWPALGLDGVFAYNDEYAMLLMRALQDAGVRVPEDVAVIGADDLMLARLTRPRLSSVRLDRASGAEFAAYVDELVRSPASRPRRRRAMTVTVTAREST